jgi:hypothetical protein
MDALECRPSNATDRSLSRGEGGGEGLQAIDRAHPLTLALSQPEREIGDILDSG